MPDRPNFLLGRGERLVEAIPAPSGGGGPVAPYTYEEALLRLAPLVRNAADEIADLPSGACPRNRAVGVVTMHPQRIAKSYFPDRLLSEFGLETVGSRPVTVQPEKWSRKQDPQPAPSTELFVAGDRQTFATWASALEHGEIGAQQARDDLVSIESFRAPAAAERVRGIRPEDADYEARQLFEVVLQ